MIYEKTTAGHQALLTRSPELPRALRNLLLLIEGTKIDADLLNLLSSSQLGPQSFADLQQLGLIAPRAATSAPPSPPVAHRTTAPKPRTPAPSAEAEPRAPRLSPFARIGQGLRAALQAREESPREISAGLAEVVRCAAVGDAELFAWLEHNIEDLRAKRATAVAHVVQRIPNLRAEIEAQDRQLRRSPSPLEFGQALGNVIESVLGFGHYLHGEAIGLGMILVTEIGQDLGVQPELIAKRLQSVLRRCGLPLELPQAAAARWLELLPVDKAGVGGQLQFILLEDIAKPIVYVVPRASVVEALDRAGALVI